MWQRVLKIHAVGIFLTVFFSFFTPTHVTSGQSGGEGWWVVNSPCLTAPPTQTLHWNFSHLYFYIFDSPNIVLDIFALFGEVWQLFTGFFLFFKGLHFAAKGFKNSCSRNFFYKVFFPFIHLHMSPLGSQVGKVGGW